MNFSLSADGGNGRSSAGGMEADQGGDADYMPAPAGTRRDDERGEAERVPPGPACSKRRYATRSRSGSATSSSSVRSGYSRERVAEWKSDIQPMLQDNRYALLAQKDHSRASPDYEPDSSECWGGEERARNEKANLKRKMSTKKEVIVVEDEECEGASEKKGKRGPGRPPTTGDYVKLAAAEEEHNAKLREEEMVAEERRIRNMSSRKLYTSMKLDLDEAVEELRQTPVQEVADKGQKCMESVLQVTKVSRNLQGKKVRELKQASVVGAAAIEVLRSRLEGESENDTARQNQLLRKELEKAKEEAKLAREETQRIIKKMEEQEAGQRERGRKRRVSISPPLAGKRSLTRQERKGSRRGPGSQ